MRVNPSERSSPSSISRVFRSARREQARAVAGGVRQLLLRQRVELTLDAGVVAEQRLEPVDGAAVAVVDVGALEIELGLAEGGRRQLERDALAVVRDVDGAVLQPAEVDARVDRADRDEEHALALDLARNEARVLLDVHDHLEVPARGAEVAQILDRLQHRGAGAIDGLGAERVAEPGDQILDPADEEEAAQHEDAEHDQTCRKAALTLDNCHRGETVSGTRRLRAARYPQPAAERRPCPSAPT